MAVLIEHLELEDINMSLNELILEIAIMLYSKGKLSLGQAGRMARMNPILFMEELGNRKIPVNYDESDFMADLKTLGIA
ncbi:MAG: UPF0175 family protein [Bacteroidia bacterium]